MRRARHFALGAVLSGCLPAVDNPDNCVLGLACPEGQYCDAMTATCAAVPADLRFQREVWTNGSIDPPLPAAGADLPGQALRRDPALFVSAGRRSLAFAAGPSPEQEAGWVLHSAPLPTGTPPGPTSYAALLGPDPGGWDSGQLSGPALLPGGPGGGVALYYAATGDPELPPYASQIGLALSPDGQTFTRRPRPVLPLSHPNEDALDLQALGDPQAILGGRYVFLYYTGLTCAAEGCRFVLLRAVSTDGENFRPGQVVLSGRRSEEPGGVAGPSVVARAGRYYLAYTRVLRAPQLSLAGLRDAVRTGEVALAVSLDGGLFSPLPRPQLLLPQAEIFGDPDGTFSPELSPQMELFFTGTRLRGAPAYSLLRTQLRLLP